MNRINVPEWASMFEQKTAPDGTPVRYRVLYGGRGGAKSWTIAIMLVLLALRSPERILCTREYQNSLQDSAKRLIEDTINRLGLGAKGNGFFTVTDREIRGRNGSVFIFLGMNGRENAIKSLEGITRVWAEEAASLSRASLEALIPTIRAEGSELWFSYNPRYPTDPIDMMFRGEQGPPPGSIVLKVNHNDNPWFPKVLEREMAYDLKWNSEKHAHVWLGEYVIRSDELIFNNWSVHAFAIPADARFYQGADWGYARDATAFVRALVGRWEGDPRRSAAVYDPKGNVLFVTDERYMVECTIELTPALFAGFDNREGVERWPNPHGWSGVPEAGRWRTTADNSRPETIKHMKDRGFNIEPAIKGAGSVEDGISFLQSYQIVVHPRCKHLRDELLSYRWATDKLTGVIQPRPIDANNHVIDALRYALEGVRRGGSRPFDYQSAGRREMADLIDRTILWSKSMSYPDNYGKPTEERLGQVDRCDRWRF